MDPERRGATSAFTLTTVLRFGLAALLVGVGLLVLCSGGDLFVATVRESGQTLLWLRMVLGGVWGVGAGR